jgi:hypothetical protein
MVNEPFALFVGLMSLWLGWCQFRQAKEPLVDSRYPFVKAKSRPLRLAAALWISFVGLIALVMAF